MQAKEVEADSPEHARETRDKGQSNALMYLKTVGKEYHWWRERPAHWV